MPGILIVADHGIVRGSVRSLLAIGLPELGVLGAGILLISSCGGVTHPNGVRVLEKA